MPGYRLSAKADKDLQSIYLYTAQQFGILQAGTYKSQLETALQLLVSNPLMGRATDHIREDLRRHEHASHIIFYRSYGPDIFIIRILPSRTDWKEHL